MRILICDDDDMIIKQLTKYLEDFFKELHSKCPEIATFSDGTSLLMDTGEKDLLFLDIEMPGMNGIHVGNELKKKNENIIIFIVTSFSEYLDEAMRFHVFRYLSKPIEKSRLFRNLKDALKLYHSFHIKITIETKQEVYTVSSSDIVLIEAIGHKTIVHTTEKNYESVSNMQHWTNTLTQNCFFQTHRSFLVNLEYVSTFNHIEVKLYNDQLIANLARRNYSQFKAAYLLYLESMR